MKAKEELKLIRMPFDHLYKGEDCWWYEDDEPDHVRFSCFDCGEVARVRERDVQVGGILPGVECPSCSVKVHLKFEEW